MVLVVGGGVNGLSVAWGLASQGAEVVLVDKGRLGGGASGIAGGIVRNYYRADAITELVRLSVDMFEEDPEAYGFRQVGYLAAVPAEQVEDLVAIREQHYRVGVRVGAGGRGRCLPRVPDLELARLGGAGGGAAARAPRRLGGRDADRAAAWPRGRGARAWRSARACRSWGSAMGVR